MSQMLSIITSAAMTIIWACEKIDCFVENIFVYVCTHKFYFGKIEKKQIYDLFFYLYFDSKSHLFTCHGLLISGLT